MCGISLAASAAATPALVERVCRMHAVARHRGPDGERFLSVGPDGRAVLAPAADALEAAGAALVLGFRRLRILDLSEAADQPLRSPDGTAFVAFNGAIFNYRELRAELERRGRAFRTTGDTEVLLAAYEAWGERCFERLDGMWAVAIVDLARGRLVLSRDRFGIKPLHWATDGPTLLVASEAKQVVAGLRGRPRPNAGLVGAFLRGNRYPCLEETFFDGVRQVPPATWCAVPLEAPATPPRFEPYWRLADFHCGRTSGIPYGEARERFEALLRSAVRAHAVADVGLGALVSGGLDSSTLAALLAGERGGAPTFSFGVEGDPRSELKHAAAVARAHGLPNHQAGLDAAWIRAHGGAAVKALEEPPLALAALAQHRLYQLAREHGTTVVLDGQGADEVLGGYAYHQRLLIADRVRRGRPGAAAREVFAIARHEGVSPLRVLSAVAVPPLAARLRRPLPWLSAGVAPRDGAAVQEARADRGRDPSALNRQLYWDVRWGNVKIVLGHTDRSAMAHSIEARVPYFDRALVEFAFTLPDHYKVGDGQRKRILRDVARPLLPPEVVDRPDRMGFVLPSAARTRDLLPDTRAAVAGSGLLSGPWLVRAEAERLLDRFAAGDDRRAPEVWRLYALATWAREFDVDLG